MTSRELLKRFGPIAAVVLFLQQIGISSVWTAVGKAMVVLSLPNRAWLQALLTGAVLTACCGALYYLLKRVLHDSVTDEFAAKARKMYLEALRKQLKVRQSSACIPLRIAPLKAQADSNAAQTIMEAFDSSKRNLLVTGPPGSGKTTTLEALAWQLAELAKDNPEAPIPFLLSLSKFDPKAFRTRWFDRLLTEELRRDLRGYPLRRWIYDELPHFLKKSDDLIHHWMKEETVIAWLLDGLDELPQDKAKEIIDFIFEQIKGQPVAVSCRNDRDLTPFASLDAVTVQPLSDTEIETYLEAASASYLMDTLRSDIYVIELARNPLFLSVMAEVGRSPEFRSRPETFSGIETLFDSYVTVMIQRHDKLVSEASQHNRRRHIARFTKDQVLATLGWLAATMTERRVTAIGKGGLAELLGRSATFPAIGFSVSLQLATSITSVTVAVCIAVLLELRYGTFGGIAGAAEVGSLAGLLAVALFTPLRILIGTTEFVKRIVMYVGRRLKSKEKTPTPARKPSAKGSTDRLMEQAYAFLARYSFGPVDWLWFYVAALGVMVMPLVLILYGTAFIGSMAMLRSTVHSLWLPSQSEFSISICLVTGLLVLGFGEGRFAPTALILVDVAGLMAINAFIRNGAGRAVLSLLLGGLILTATAMQSSQRRRWRDIAIWMAILSPLLILPSILIT